MMLGSVFNQRQASRSELSRTILRIMKIGKDSYPFSEFRGLGSPGVDLGQLGDIYIDITPGLHALYGRYPESWILWPGANDASNLLRHPLHSDRCLWCHATVGWIHHRHVRVNSVNPSELLSEALKSQEKSSAESKKRRRESLLQPIRTELPSSTTNTSSPSQSRNSVENQSATDALPFLSSTMPYSQPAHEIMISRTLTPNDISIIQNSDCIRPPTTARRRFIPTETDPMFTSHNLNELSIRSPQEQYTSPKRIDLRKVTFVDTKLRPFGKSQRRRLSLPTHTKSISYPAYEEQSPSQPSIHDSETLRIFRNDDSPLGSARTSSAATFREPFVNNTDPEDFPVKPFSLDLSDITGGSFITKHLPYSASVASTNLALPAEGTQRSHINNELALEIAIAELRKIKDAFDANVAHLREANDKIHHLEAENAKLHAQLLCRSNSPPSDIPLMITNVEMPPIADSHGLIGAEELSQSRRELTGPLEIVGHSPQLYPRYSPCESSFAPEHLATPPASLLLAGTETTSSVHVLPPTESATVSMECRNTIDILNVEADTLSPDGCKSESTMNTCSPVKDVISWHASPVPTSTLPRMREIHRSVLFAKAGTLLICRICLGTKLGGIETLDQAFQISEDSPELMQEHYEKEHPIDCEAVLNMSDEDLVDVVSMLSMEY